ncbi:hypothetical protein HK105_201724 [Polyrhizophydium stewartii]|uniref:Transmembrane protein 135 N-terminal domain-containing protein n=1 Tax=Polyrhizophydium stewartii TaxID=2732419 RepID=A0ABR4NH83_9FUNG
MSFLENFIESVAQVLSLALTDKETERLLSSFTALQQRLRELSVDNLRRLEAQSRKRKLLCKHPGPCAVNAGRSFVRTFAITYALKYALGFVPAVLTGKAFTKPRILVKIGGRDTISFALFMSLFISSYKAVLCTLRNVRQTNDKWNAFIAGSLAGLSILADKNKSRRIMIALYLSTRTTHFLSRWLWRAHVSRWSEKLGFHNPNAITAAGGSNGNGSDADAVVLHSRVASDSSDAGSSVSGASLTVSTARDDGGVEFVIGSASARTPRQLGTPKRSYEMVDGSPLVHRRGNTHQQRANGNGHGSGSDSELSPVAAKSSDPAHEDVDDLHHTHHPLRKTIRQASAAIVMMLSSSQILHDYVTDPDTLAKSYNSFLLTHGGLRDLDPKKPSVYMDAMGEVVRNCASMETTKYLPIPPGGSFADSIPKGIEAAKLLLYQDKLTQHSHEFVLCSIFHPHSPHCIDSVTHAFYKEWYRAMALYGPLNLIMTLIFRGKKTITQPVRTLRQIIVSVLRSSLFLTCYVTAAWTLPCLFRTLRGRDEPWMYYINGIVSGAMVMIEVPGRRLELALYCMPRAIESLYNHLVKKGYARHVPFGEAIYFCLSTGVLMTLYQTDPGSIHSGYRKIMYRFFGVN